jgi:diphthamide synthase (EF-2-diphthine--ammonia ligase)
VSGASSGPVALSWSGGKDSALALWALREELGTEPAQATGIELVEIPIPAGCVNATYEERMANALASPPLDRVPTVAFGDLFLADVRTYRETRLAGAGRSARFPLWRRDTTALAHEFIDAGFEATLVSADRSRARRGREARRLRLPGPPLAVTSEPARCRR